MKSPYVSELQVNQVATAAFLVSAKDIRQKKTGEPYLSLTLSDRTGEIDAKMWDNVAEVMETFDRDDFVKVRGLMQVYQNKQQLTVHRLQRMEPSEVDFADFFPASSRDPEEMFRELRSLIAGFSNPHLKALLTAIFDDEAVARRFKLAPAAKSIHHAYLGGLIEHVLSLCSLCRVTAAHYKQIDLDLLLTGAILHDIGKTVELSYDRSFNYTDDGQLLGHIIIALRMIDEKARLIPDFPPRLRTLVEHMIISHHGELEYGSPKVPLFLEALLLHHLDNLDSKMEAMRQAAERDRTESNWSGWVPAMERIVLKKDRYLNGSAPAPAKAPEKKSATRPQSGSLFGDKLFDALKPEGA
jgi:3'-5' exoribonuclease